MKKSIILFGVSAIIAALVAAFAHIALMPRLIMQNAERVTTSVEEVDEVTLRAPINQIAFSAGLYTADIDISEVGATGPMADMLYANGWLDVSDEPMIFDIPNFGDRYFVIPFTNQRNLNTGYIGTRATGNQGGRYAVVGLGWEGRLPEGVERIEASTPHVNFIFRVYVAGPDDFEAADSLRRQVKLYPLSDLAAD
jgi:hypothetical protein